MLWPFWDGVWDPKKLLRFSFDVILSHCRVWSSLAEGKWYGCCVSVSHQCVRFLVNFTFKLRMFQRSCAGVWEDPEFKLEPTLFQGKNQMHCANPAGSWIYYPVRPELSLQISPVIPGGVLPNFKLFPTGEISNQSWKWAPLPKKVQLGGKGETRARFNRLAKMETWLAHS